MSNDDEIVVQLTAETAKLQAGMDEGAAAVTKATEEMRATIAEEAAAFNAAVQLKVDAMVRLNAAFADGVVNTAGIAEAEAALDQAMAAGAITAAEYAGYVGTLNTAEIDLATSTAAATMATEANTVAMTINGGVARELGVMIGELARGNYTRLEGSAITLANRTNLLSSAISAVLSPLGMLAVAAAAVGYEIFEAGQRFDEMEGTVLATGEAAGYTAGQLIGMANEIGQSSGNIGVATEAVQKLAESGRFAGEDLRLVAQAATDMAALTGQSIQSAVAQIEKLQEDPVKAVAKLNDQFHFLTVAQFKEIEAAQQAGDSMRAASIAYEAMADKMQGRTDELNTHANILIRSWRELRQVWGESMQEADHALGGGDDAYGLNEAKLLLATLEKQKKQAEEMGSSALPGINLQIAAQQKTVDDLTAKFKAQADAAAAVGKAAQKSAEQIGAMAKASGKKKGDGAGHADHEQAQADRDAFNEQRLQHSMSLAEEKTYWQAKLAAAKEGTDAYRQAVNELLQIKGKEATEGKAAARQEMSDAKRVAEEKIRAGKEVERAQEAAARKQRELSLEQLKASRDESIGALANKRSEYQLDYAEGRISAAQLLQLEEDLAAQKLAIEKKYYQDKAKLDAGDKVAITKDSAGIVKAKQDALAAMLAAEKQYHKNSEKEWKNYAKKVEGAMQGAINGMLFQHQTLRQGVANVAMVMGEEFIQEAVMKPLDKWIAAEAAKVSTSLGTSTSLQAQRVADSAAEAARSVASVARAVGVAGAQGTASFAGAPWPVDMGAPAFGAAMAASAASFGSIASARGGWSRVPIDGAMTELHVDEKVLPAKEARGLDKLINGGGQGGGNHFHVTAVDTRSFADAIRRDPRAMADGIKKAHRLGYLGSVR